MNIISSSLSLLVVSIFLISILPSGINGDADTEKIAKCVCTKNKKGADFHDCVAKCQRINPYNMKGNQDPNEKARNKLYKKGQLVQDNRSKICQNDKTIEDFIEELKVQVGELKSTVKTECNNEPKLEQCYKTKKDCFKKCCKDADEWK